MVCIIFTSHDVELQNLKSKNCLYFKSYNMNENYQQFVRMWFRIQH